MIASIDPESPKKSMRARSSAAPNAGEKMHNGLIDESRPNRASARGGVCVNQRFPPHDFKGWLLKEFVGFYLVTILKLEAF